MRKVQIVRSDLERTRQKVVELEAELKAAEEFEQQMTAETKSYAEKFNEERNRNAANPFK